MQPTAQAVLSDQVPHALDLDYARRVARARQQQQRSLATSQMQQSVSGRYTAGQSQPGPQIAQAQQIAAAPAQIAVPRAP